MSEEIKKNTNFEINEDTKKMIDAIFKKDEENRVKQQPITQEEYNIISPLIYSKRTNEIFKMYFDSENPKETEVIHPFKLELYNEIKNNNDREILSDITSSIDESNIDPERKDFLTKSVMKEFKLSKEIFKILENVDIKDFAPKDRTNKMVDYELISLEEELAKRKVRTVNNSDNVQEEHVLKRQDQINEKIWEHMQKNGGYDKMVHEEIQDKKLPEKHKDLRSVMSNKILNLSSSETLEKPKKEPNTPKIKV